MIHFHAVTKHYNDSSILKNVNFHLQKGEFAFLKGRSGSGKSTFLKSVYREIDIDAGTIEVNGKDNTKIAKYELRRQIGVIFQSFELIEKMTVFENIAIAGKAIGTPIQEIEQQAMRLLKRVGLEHKRDAYPSQLSGGQQQRVAIVRALLNHPPLLVADEPTGNLDEETAAKIMQLLHDLHKEEQITMLIVTHAQWTIPDSKIWVMEEGCIHEQTTV
ncbi:MAG TPA: ABC transporter ATP-binding protein [Ureibacillus sp.]|nr:ABC transporter ATP-binding protein [Ureibacillus sp.]